MNNFLNKNIIHNINNIDEPDEFLLKKVFNIVDSDGNVIKNHNNLELEYVKNYANGYYEIYEELLNPVSQSTTSIFEILKDEYVTLEFPRNENKSKFLVKVKIFDTETGFIKLDVDYNDLNFENFTFNYLPFIIRYKDEIAWYGNKFENDDGLKCFTKAIQEPSKVKIISYDGDFTISPTDEPDADIISYDDVTGVLNISTTGTGLENINSITFLLWNNIITCFNISPLTTSNLSITLENKIEFNNQYVNPFRKMLTYIEETEADLYTRLKETEQTRYNFLKTINHVDLQKGTEFFFTYISKFYKIVKHNNLNFSDRIDVVMNFVYKYISILTYKEWQKLKPILNPVGWLVNYFIYPTNNYFINNLEFNMSNKKSYLDYGYDFLNNKINLVPISDTKRCEKIQIDSFYTGRTIFTLYCGGSGQDNSVSNKKSYLDYNYNFIDFVNMPIKDLNRTEKNTNLFFSYSKEFVNNTELIITSPINLSSFPVNKFIPITWTLSTGDDSQRFIIEYFDGLRWEVLTHSIGFVDNLRTNGGRFYWHVPNNIGNLRKIKISLLSNIEIRKVSNFEIIEQEGNTNKAYSDMISITQRNITELPIKKSNGDMISITNKLYNVTTSNSDMISITNKKILLESL